MNGFQSRGRGMSSHETASTTGKKTANSTDGKTTARRQPSAERGRDGILPDVLLRLALLGALAGLAPASAAAAQPLALSSPFEHVGWVTLRITGPPGAAVAIAEDRGPVATLTLPAT